MKVLYNETGVLTIQAENDLERFALSSWRSASVDADGCIRKECLKVDVEVPPTLSLRPEITLG